MGLSRAEIDKAMPSIEAFAEIGEFIERPVKEYSSGMYVRLAFSTAIHVDPEILIVDEALAVGDAVFANRCVRKFEELRARKITVLFVSHDLGLVKQLSDRAILLLNGRIEAQGTPNDVINRYIGLVLERQQARNKKEDRVRGSFRHGDGTSEILSVGDSERARRAGDFRRERRADHGPRALALPAADARSDGGHSDAHAHRDGRVRHQHAHRADASWANCRPGDELEVDFQLDCWLTPQQYTLTVATQDADGPATTGWTTRSLSTWWTRGWRPAWRI